MPEGGVIVRMPSKLGRCRSCMIASSSLATGSLILLALSIVGFYAFANPLISLISFLGVGFFGTLTGLHLVARLRMRRALGKHLAQMEAEFMKQAKEAAVHGVTEAGKIAKDMIDTNNNPKES